MREYLRSLQKFRKNGKTSVWKLFHWKINENPCEGEMGEWRAPSEEENTSHLHPVQIHSPILAYWFKPINIGKASTLKSRLNSLFCSLFVFLSINPHKMRFCFVMFFFLFFLSFETNFSFHDTDKIWFDHSEFDACDARKRRRKKKNIISADRR